MPMTDTVRVIVLGKVTRKDGKCLFFKGYDRVKNEYFYRSVGGGIEFGEKAEEALKREFMEEIQTEIIVHDRLGFFENIYTFNGRKGHEYVMIYDVEFKDKSLYARDSVIGNEDNGESFLCEWIDVNAVKEPIYPAGTKDLVLTSLGRKKTV